MLDQNKTQSASEILKGLTLVKVGKSLNLALFGKTKRNGIMGKSTSMFGEDWFLLPKGKALFKVFEWPNMHSSLPGNISMVNEILCSYLAKQIGLPCANYEVSYYNDYKGVVTYNILNENEVTKDVMQYYFSRFVQSLDDLEKVGYKFDRQEIYDNVFKGIVFQYLIMQTDSKSDCFIFGLDSQTRNLRFAGICDNEFAFNMSMFRSQQYLETVFNNGVDPLDIIAGFNSRIFYKCIKINYGDFRNCDYFSSMREICNFANSNPHAKQLLTEMLSNLDVDAAFEQLEKNDKIEVDPSYRRYVKAIVDYGKAEFKKELDAKSSQQE